VAATILFLASDDAAHITGQDLLCDGGHSIAGDLSRVPGIPR
jgi:NAD(P)-dependent dehydrogenase (short-subunit alcohol dehydrogenase family)